MDTYYTYSWPPKRGRTFFWSTESLHTADQRAAYYCGSRTHIHKIYTLYAYNIYRYYSVVLYIHT